MTNLLGRKLNECIASLEASADKIIAELEASRDLTQSIVHIDMDSFYASVEVRFSTQPPDPC